jgi:hypothetical protein
MEVLEMKKNNLKVNDKVQLLDGRTGVIINQDKENNNYFKVETYNGDGNKTYFKIFYRDMNKIED